jgi:pSer/pThr/pTyr-binding forkhead associated (FHA) protein
MYLRVVKMRGGAQVDESLRFELSDGELIAGRADDVDIVLTDRRVSRRHARFVAEDGAVWLENLSRYGTFINLDAIQQRVQINAGDFIQLGGILLEVCGDESVTEPPSRLISIDMDAEPSQSMAKLVIVSPGDQVRIFGRSVVLQPGPFKALRTLALSAGQWVSFDALAEGIWGEDWPNYAGYTNKYVSYARKGVMDALTGTTDGHTLMHQAIVDNADAFTRSDGLDDTDLAGLLREFIKARKKVGFRMHLSADDVVLRGS